VRDRSLGWCPRTNPGGARSSTKNPAAPAARGWPTGFFSFLARPRKLQVRHRFYGKATALTTRHSVGKTGARVPAGSPRWSPKIFPTSDGPLPKRSRFLSLLVRGIGPLLLEKTTRLIAAQSSEVDVKKRKEKPSAIRGARHPGQKGPRSSTDFCSKAGGPDALFRRGEGRGAGKFRSAPSDSNSSIR